MVRHMTPESSDLSVTNVPYCAIAQRCYRHAYSTPPQDLRHLPVRSTSPGHRSIHSIASYIYSLTITLSTSKIQNTMSAIEKFLSEVFKRSNISVFDSIVPISLIYMTRIYSSDANSKFPEFAHCAKRVYLCSLILAHKYLMDNTFSMHSWSKISGLPVKHLITMESWALKQLNYALFVHPTAINAIGSPLARKRRISDGEVVHNNAKRCLQ